MSLSVAAHAAIIAILIAIVPAVERHDGSFVVAYLLNGAGGDAGASGAKVAAQAGDGSKPTVGLARPTQPPHPIHHRHESDQRHIDSVGLKSGQPPREVPGTGAGTSTAAGTNAGDSQSSAAGGSGRGDGIGNGGAGHGGGEGDGSGEARVAYGENPAPAYPQSARRRNEQGTVILRVLVGADGLVRSVEVVETSGFDALDESAIEAVRRRWHFVAAHRDGAPVESWVRVPIRFSLTEARAAN